MLKKRTYAYTVAPSSEPRALRLSLPYPLVLGMGILAFIGIIAVGIGMYHYSWMVLQVGDYQHLLTENDAFRAENHSYRIQTAQLGEKIDFLETTSRKLMVIAGMDSVNGPGGVGGFSNESFSRPLSPSAGSLQSIGAYNKGVNALESRYLGLQQYLSDKILYSAATPQFLPVKGYVTGGIGLREDPFNSSTTDYHTGIDISAPYGSRVVAPADGTVIFAGQRAGYGNIVVIDHKFGIVTRYGHLWKFNVEAGQFVSRNDLIGYVGSSGRSTGPHLHYELWLHNRIVNPQKYFRPSSRVG